MVLTEEQKQLIKTLADKPFPFVERCEVQTLEVERGYCKMRMPLAPNRNHVGTMYAGALATIAELPAGVIFLASFDSSRYYPVAKDMAIRFRRPASSDVTVEVRISEEEIQRIAETTESAGKCDFEWEVELKDNSGEVVAIAHNLYQMRKR